ncbi:hypothetical protein C8T65DRAFT_694947 [Cerioporus squamosus]|nr:hypothetical protein C8T65DRAFT_694947 [Cerioporus squamosus]
MASHWFKFKLGVAVTFRRCCPNRGARAATLLAQLVLKPPSSPEPLPQLSPQGLKTMLSDVELFFAEQEAIMNRPSESIADYLARRQRSDRTSTSYPFNPETIAIGSSDAISVLQECRDARPASPPHPGFSLSGPHRSSETTAQLSDPVPTEENSLERKRKADDAGPALDRRQRKKSKSIDELPTQTTASAAMALPPGTRVGASKASSSTNTDQHTGRLAELSPPAALATIEVDARVRTGAHKSLAGKSELPTSSASSSDVHIDGQKRPSGVRELKVDSGSRHDAPRDCSNITTPPNTAPESVAPVSKGPAGKTTAATRPREPEERAIAGRNTAAAKKPKGKKDKEPRYTPSEYAKVLQARFAELQQGGKTKVPQFLRGKRIYFYGGDLNTATEATRRRMELIVKHGGELLSEFDPDRTTHIVCDRLVKRSLLSAIQLKQLSDIPDHIPTVTWEWVVSGQGRKPVKRTSQEGERGKGNTGQVSDAPADEDEYEYPMGKEWDYLAFPERVDAGNAPWAIAARTKSERERQTKNRPAKEGQSGGLASSSNLPAGESSDDISHISDFTQDKVSPGDGAKICPNAGLPSPPSSPSYPRSDPPQPLNRDLSTLAPRADSAAEHTAGPSTTTKFVVGSDNDPLAEFYAQARAERDAEWLGQVESDDESVSGEGSGGRAAESSKGGKEKRSTSGACPNQEVIAKLETLRTYILRSLAQRRDGVFSRSTKRVAIAVLRKHPTKVRTEAEARKLPGIGKQTAQKIAEVISTGDLRRIKFELTEDIPVLQLLQGIYDVGPKLAQVWYYNGVRTLADVAARKGGIKLSRSQKIGLKYYDDINTRIPRAEVQEIYDMIQVEALRIDPKLFIRVMGSFRRGKADCGDIDVLITRPTNDGKTHRGVLRRLLAELHKKGVITDDLSLPSDFEDLELSYRGLCRRDAQSRRRRIDFLTVPWKSRGAALLYYTGDDIFNRSMRMKANTMGYSLNQRGLFAGVIRDPSDRRKKLHDGKVIASESEEEIFRILGVPWQEPHERIRN